MAAHQAQRQEDEALRAGLRAAVEETQREAGEETERLRQPEEALRTAAEQAERPSMAEHAGRVAVKEAERLRHPKEGRVATEEDERQRQEGQVQALPAASEPAASQEEAHGERVRVQRQARRVPAQSPRPKTITDSRFEIGGRYNRALHCDECGIWFRGGDVGTFWHTGPRVMPPAESRKAAWERGDWDASWYCIECCADYWECEAEQVKEYLGFSNQQSRKVLSMGTRAASASTGPANPPKAKKPARIDDTRFAKERELRHTRCDECKQMKGGNEAGAFCYRENMPAAGEREAAWVRGEWDASWYCTQCYMLYWKCLYEEVRDRLNFSERAGKKARFVTGLRLRSVI